MIMPRNEPAKEPIRKDLVARIRQEIQQGRYDTPEKLEIALLRLLSEVEEAEEVPDALPPLCPGIDAEALPPPRRLRPSDSL
jgi:hypothetical protein